MSETFVVYASAAVDVRQTSKADLKRVVLYDYLEMRDLPDNISGIVKFFQDIEASIPDEYRDAVKCEYETGYDGDGHMKIYYDRPETTDERLKREKDDAESAKRYRQQEIDRAIAVLTRAGVIK